MSQTRELLNVPRKLAEIKDFGTGNDLAFSPDGKWLAGSNASGVIGVWNAHTGEEIYRIGHTEDVEEIAISPDSKWLAAVYFSGDYTVDVWEMTTGKAVTRLIHTDCVTTLAFSPRADLLATGGDEKTIHLWSTQTWQEEKCFTLNDTPISLQFHPTKPYLISGSSDGLIQVWNYALGEKVRVLDNQSAFNYTILSPDGSLLATKEFMGHVNIWETENWIKISEIFEPTISLAGQAMEISHDGNWLMLGYGEFETYGGIRLYAIKTGQLVNNIYRSKTVGTLAYSPDGKWLGAGGGDYIAGSRAPSKAWIFKSSTGEQLSWMQCKGTVWKVAFSPDGSTFATRDDVSIQLWDILNE
jgi:WD40 repeat protein